MYSVITEEDRKISDPEEREKNTIQTIPEKATK